MAKAAVGTGVADRQQGCVAGKGEGDGGRPCYVKLKKKISEQKKKKKKNQDVREIVEGLRRVGEGEQTEDTHTITVAT